MPKKQFKHKPLPPMREEIRARFQALINAGKKTVVKQEKTSIIKPKGALWRWDTLDDVDFDGA